MWLFTSHNLSSKMHRWALKMMAYDMVLRWRKGTDHVAPDAFSMLRKKSPGEPDIDTTLPGDGDGEGPGKGPEGPVLDGVPLQSMAQSHATEDEASGESPPELALLNREPEDITLDGICLVDLGPTEIDDLEEENLSVFYALQITPEALTSRQGEYLTAYQQAQSLLTPRKPKAAILGRGAGGTLQAVAGLLEVACVIDSDWKTMKCIRVNGGAGDADLIRQPLDSTTRQTILEYKPGVLVGNACVTEDDQDGGGKTGRTAEAIVQIFVSSPVQILVMESAVGFAGSERWKNILKPELHVAGCDTATASLSAMAVGIPTTKGECLWSQSKRVVIII